MRITAILLALVLFNGSPKEDRVKIAVIDSGVDMSFKHLKPYLCKTGHKSFVDDAPLTDSTEMRHGTNVAGLIALNIDPTKACLVIVKFYSTEKSDTEAAINYAVSQRVQYINMSLGGSGYSTTEHLTLAGALNKGIKIAAAAGNDHKNLDNNCYYYPACYTKNLKNDSFKVVGSNTFGNRHYTNYGSIVSTTENGTGVGMPRLTGTSQATAIFMGKWVKKDLQ